MDGGRSTMLVAWSVLTATNHWRRRARQMYLSAKWVETETSAARLDLVVCKMDRLETSYVSGFIQNGRSFWQVGEQSAHLEQCGGPEMS